jgi:hypothetical protein
MKSYIVLALAFFTFTHSTQAIAQADTASRIRVQADSTSKAKALQDSSMVRITLKDGSNLNGKILTKDSTRIVLLSDAGMKSEIPRSNIESMERLITGPQGEYVRSDPNVSRLFFAPTGRTIAQGSGYFSDYELLFPFLAYGVTDFLTLSGGFSLIPGLPDQLFYFSAKARVVHANLLDLSAGYFYAGLPTSGLSSSLSLPFASATIGSDLTSLTVGYGIASVGGSSSGMMVIGGEAQLSNSFALLSENWVPLGGSVVVYSFGMRFFGDHLAADFGLFGVSTNSGSGFPFLPWIGFAYNWGTSKPAAL